MMKIKKYFLILAIIPLLTFAACGNNNNDDDDNNDDNNPTPTLSKKCTANINGSSFVASTILVQNVASTKVINCASSTYNTISITIPTNPAIGEHDLDGLSFAIGYSTYTGEMYSFDSGKITISSYDDATGQVKGTFHFQGSELTSSSTVNVTDGIIEAY